MCIVVHRDGDVLAPDPSQAQAMGPEGTWRLISRLTTVLVRELEPGRLEEVERGLADIASRVTATTDLEMVVPGLIHLLGGDSKALRALKMVSKCVRLCCCVSARRDRAFLETFLWQFAVGLALVWPRGVASLLHLAV